MPDDSITPDNGDSVSDSDLAVAIGTLEVDGIRPSVGDEVSCKVKGPITKIVNEVAYVTPETVNDQPIPADAPDATDDELMKSAMAHDQMAPTY
jgi:hypothetical protein